MDCNSPDSSVPGILHARKLSGLSLLSPKGWKHIVKYGNLSQVSIGHGFGWTSGVGDGQGGLCAAVHGVAKSQT